MECSTRPTGSGMGSAWARQDCCSASWRLVVVRGRVRCRRCPRGPFARVISGERRETASLAFTKESNQGRKKSPEKALQAGTEVPFKSIYDYEAAWTTPGAHRPCSTVSPSSPTSPSRRIPPRRCSLRHRPLLRASSSSSKSI